MKKSSKNLIFSPSDLTIFWESPFASWMDRYKLETPDCPFKRDDDDQLMKLLQDKGYKHEETEIGRLKEEGLQITTISTDDENKAKEDTLAAIKRGDEVIFQARLERDNFAGWADFLIRKPGKSTLGDYHYEVWDTKLSGKLKSYFALQLCAYMDMLEPIQGIIPKEMAVVLGKGERSTLAVTDFYGYYKIVKQNLLDYHDSWDTNHKPDPGSARNLRHWSDHGRQIMEEADSLAQIAGINKNQRFNLETAGITTMAGLASSKLKKVHKMSERVFSRLQEQCALQIASRGLDRPKFTVLDHQELSSEHGLNALPPQSTNDVFFDIEGYPLIDGGLEYLWGNSYWQDGELKFRDFWAHSHEQEQKAFEDFIDWIMELRSQDPTMHVYHYAPYETNAIKRLMGRYRTREEEVDTLLREKVFVDLYQVVRQGLRIGGTNYSIKTVELLYRGKRDTEVADGASSVVVYEAYMNQPDGDDWQSSRILKDIRDYNIDDCESTWELTDWLRKTADANGIDFKPKATDRSNTDNTDQEETSALVQQLLLRAETHPEAKLLAELVTFHRRENKPKCWRFYERIDKYQYEDLYGDNECLAGLKLISGHKDEAPEKRVYVYSFDGNQECKLKPGSKGVCHHNEQNMEIIRLDLDAQTAAFKYPTRSQDPFNEFSFVANDIIPSRSLVASIKNFANSWLAGTLHSTAVMNLLQRQNPRIKDHDGGPLVKGEHSVESSIEVVERMQNTCLSIQGPPGAGKTYTASRLIAHLVRQGYRVGVTSNGHKAINHLMTKTYELLKDEDIQMIKVESKATDPMFEATTIEHCNGSGKLKLDQNTLLVGGTAWTFANKTTTGQFDYVFVDEAGQVSLANLTAMAQSTNNFVFLGDQMQLNQPIQGSHPGDSGKSILEFLLEGHATIPPEKGIFLPQTYRLHPDICSFISKLVYEDRLQPAPVTAKRVISNTTDGIPASGICYIPVEHEGNSQASEEEIEAIQSLTNKLLKMSITDEDGKQRPATMDDILFVAPYNMQVRMLQNKLGPDARVGSVDKFQGQEAAIVIISMCSSNAESGRGIDFLFSKNRLNVAVSRAESLVFVVGHPGLPNSFATNVASMAKINLYGSLVTEAIHLNHLTPKLKKAS